MADSPPREARGSRTQWWRVWPGSNPCSAISLLNLCLSFLIYEIGITINTLQAVVKMRWARAWGTACCQSCSCLKYRALQSAFLEKRGRRASSLGKDVRRDIPGRRYLTQKGQNSLEFQTEGSGGIPEVGIIGCRLNGGHPFPQYIYGNPNLQFLCRWLFFLNRVFADVITLNPVTDVLVRGEGHRFTGWKQRLQWCCHKLIWSECVPKIHVWRFECPVQPCWSRGGLCRYCGSGLSIARML